MNPSHGARGYGTLNRPAGAADTIGSGKRMNWEAAFAAAPIRLA